MAPTNITEREFSQNKNTQKIQQIFNKEFLLDLPEEKFAKVQFLESEELLDNLGYIDINQNVRYKKTSKADIIKGIADFRNELDSNKEFFKDLYRMPESTEPGALTEDELKILGNLSSLEGEFDLHRYTKKEIQKNPLLIRCLNYRFWILSIFQKDVTPDYLPETDKYLDKIGKWTNTTSHAEIIELLGDAEKLSHRICEQLTYKDSKYMHVVYFENDLDSDIEKEFKHHDNRQLFESRFITPEIKSSFKKTVRNKTTIDSLINDELNILMTRMVQLRLWLLGTYGGLLDNDLKSMSLQAIKDLLLYGETLTENYKLQLSDFIIYLRNNQWALNTTFLINLVLPLLGGQESDKNVNGDTSTLACEIGNLFNNTKIENEGRLIHELNNIINDDDVIMAQADVKRGKRRHRKTKTQGSKGLFRSIGRFFKRVADLIKDSFDLAVQALRDLFGWIKNGVKMLLREIKDIYSRIKKGLAFFFSKRNIVTTSQNAIIDSDFDSNFDSITKTSLLNKGLVMLHIGKNNEIIASLEETSDFLGTVFSIALKMAKGPFGWLQLGILVIKELAGKN